MKQLFTKISILLVPIFAVILVLNYTMDPGHLFANSYIEQDVCDELLAGKDNVPLAKDLNYRMVKKKYLEQTTSDIHTMVVGSSRSYQVNTANAQATNLFNGCVTSGNLSDCISMYQIAKENEVGLKQLIIGLDPWMIDNSRGKKHNLEAHTVFRETYATAFAEMGLKDFSLIPPVSLLETFGPEYAEELISLNGVQHAFKLACSEEEQEALDLDACPYFNADGSFVYHHGARSRSTESTLEMAKEYVASEKDKDMSLSDDNKQQFEAFIKMLEADGVQPVIFLAPYHPYVYEKVSEKWPVYKELEDYLLSFTSLNEIEIIGSYNPKNVGAGEADFYDHYHPRQKTIDQLFLKK